MFRAFLFLILWFAPLVRLGLAMSCLRREASKHFLVPAQMLVFLAPNLPNRPAHDLLQIAPFDLVHQRAEQFPVPMIFGFGKEQISRFFMFLKVSGTSVDRRPRALCSAASAEGLF